MTCTKIVLTDTLTVTIPGGRFIVLKDVTFARVRLKWVLRPKSTYLIKRSCVTSRSLESFTLIARSDSQNEGYE